MGTFLKKGTRQRLLDLMVARVGLPALAQRLDVSVGMADGWRHGTTTMPDRKLIVLINLIDETNEE